MAFDGLSAFYILYGVLFSVTAVYSIILFHTTEDFEQGTDGVGIVCYRPSC